MNMKSLLNQLLGSGSDLLQGKNTGQQGHGHSSAQHSSSYGSQQQSGSDIGSQLSSLLSGKGGAALAGGALGLLLGSKSGRKMGGKVLTYGGLAALGALAFKAYQNYQQQQSATAQAANPAQPFNSAQPLEQLPAPAQEAHSKAILVALIAAAKADGHIDAKERQLIDGEIAKITNDNSIMQWFDAELQKPLDPAEIARYATDQAMASEMFLASVLVVDEESFMEKSYLQELARQLQLPPELQQSLRAQVAAVRQSLQ